MLKGYFCIFPSEYNSTQAFGTYRVKLFHIQTKLEANSKGKMAQVPWPLLYQKQVPTWMMVSISTDGTQWKPAKLKLTTVAKPNNAQKMREDAVSSGNTNFNAAIDPSLPRPSSSPPTPAGRCSFSPSRAQNFILQTESPSFINLLF